MDIELLQLKLTQKVLEKMDANPKSYDLDPDLDNEIKCYNGFSIKRVVNGYFLYEIINGQKFFREHLSSLETICNHLIEKHQKGENPYYWDEEQRIRRIDEIEAPFREAERKRKQRLKDFVERYEAKQKLEDASPQMNFEKLKYILIKENIHDATWDILETGHVRGYDGVVLKKADNGGYDILYMERGESSLLNHAEDEHIACLMFLNTFAEDGKGELVKYINFNELPRNSLLITRLPNVNPLRYDLQSAIRLSLKLGRTLTSEESKQFER